MQLTLGEDFGLFLLFHHDLDHLMNRSQFDYLALVILPYVDALYDFCLVSVSLVVPKY